MNFYNRWAVSALKKKNMLNRRPRHIQTRSSSPLIRVTAVLIATLLGTYANAAISASITFNYTGTISYVNPAPYASYISIGFGDTLSGHYTFESTLSPQLDYYGYGSYASDYSYLDALVLDVGNVHFALGPTNPGDWQDTRIIVANDCACGLLSGDHYRISGDKYGSYQFVFDLADPSNNALQNTSLPLVTPNLAAFVTTTWKLYAPGQNWDQYGTMELVASGSIASLTAVPVPAAGWLLLSGIAGLIGFARRQA